jgi:hypothetical protein
MELKTSHHLYPPFPEGLTTAPLVSISLSKLEADDAAESHAFFKASKELGFFYLSMEGSALGEKLVSQAEQLHLVQKEFHSLPNHEKDKFAREKLDPFFGYRILGKREMEDGTIQRDENYNVNRLIPSLLSSLITDCHSRCARMTLSAIVNPFLALTLSSRTGLCWGIMPELAAPPSTSCLRTSRRTLSYPSAPSPSYTVLKSVRETM